MSRPPATRSSLVQLRRRLAQVERGAELLERKRESLVNELFDRARPMVDQRRAIEEQALAAYALLLQALAKSGSAELAAISWPFREIEVDLELRPLWGVQTARLRRSPALVRTLAARGAAPSFGDGAAHRAAEAFERFLELILAGAPEEQLLRRLGEALARTSRLVNTLQKRVGVKLAADLAGVVRSLDEREREEQLRLKRIATRRRAR